MRFIVKAGGIYFSSTKGIRGSRRWTPYLSHALAAAQVSSAQMAVASKMARMNADNAASIVEVLNAVQRNMASLANLAAGVGQNLNITA